MAYNVLVVDDSRTTRKAVSKAIRLSGLEVQEIFEAEDGHLALDCLKDNSIDIMLTDLNMPEMSGLELVRRMAAEESLKDIPVIVISSEGCASIIDALKAGGVKNYIRKPFTPELIAEAITKAVEEL
jgi:two-component system chemotaxis response regulator CheY